MFGLSPAVREDPVHALVGADVLSQRGHRVVPEHRGVEGVAAPVREGGGVRGLARVGGRELLDRDHVHASQVEAGRVDHERGVDALERAPAGEQDLPAASLLGRRAHHDHPSAQLLGQRRGGQAGAEAGGGDDVVPAGVPDPGQRVVLAQHRDRRAGGAGSGHERGVEPVRRPLHLEALVGEDAGEEVVGELLLVVQLRVGVDLVRGIHEEAAASLHRLSQALLGGDEVGGGGHVSNASRGAGPASRAGCPPRAGPGRWGTRRGRGRRPPTPGGPGPSGR